MLKLYFVLMFVEDVSYTKTADLGFTFELTTSYREVGALATSESTQ